MERWHIAVVIADSRLLITASTDSSAQLFDVFTGQFLFEWKFQTPLRAVHIAEGDNKFLLVQRPVKPHPPQLHVLTLNCSSPSHQDKTPVRSINLPTQCQCALWGPMNATIWCACLDGIHIYDAQTLELVETLHDHSEPINSMAFDVKKIFLVSCSDDRTAKLYDVATRKCVKTYTTDKPVNTACVSPRVMHVVTGGGQKAHAVTTTHGKVGQFESRFFDMVHEEELGLLKGHFGPINTNCFSPDGSLYVSGSEDGFIRIHLLPEAYFSTALDVNQLAKKK